MGYFNIYPNLYVVLVGPPGKCYSDDTDVLTDSGWKCIKDITVEDKVLSSDANGVATFMPVTDTQEIWTDKAIRFHQRGKIDLLVSPDHSMVVQDKHTRNLCLIPAASLIDCNESTLLFPLSSDISEGKTTKINKVEKTVLDYKSNMYCLSTPLETIYVRRNGIACWSGNCRKGISMGAAINLVTDMTDVKMSADSITREALIKAIKTSEQSTEREGKPYMHSSLTIISKELSVFLGSGNHDLLSLLTDLYDNHDRWEYRTKNSGVDTIHNLWLNMLAASTPSWLVGSIPLTAIGGGFTSRVIFVVEEDVRRKNPRPRLTSKEIELQGHLKDDLEKISMLSGEMILTKEAGEYFDKWYLHDNTKIEDNRFWGYAERKHVHLLKVAMIMSACSSDSKEITIVHIKDALGLLNVIESHMVKAFGAAGRSPMAMDIDEVLNAIKIAGVIERSQLQKISWVNVHPTDFTLVINTLMEMGMITAEYDTDTQKTFYKFQKDLV